MVGRGRVGGGRGGRRKLRGGMAETVHGARGVGSEEAAAVNGADTTVIITIQVDCFVLGAAKVLCVVPRGFSGWKKTGLSYSSGTATKGTKQRGRCSGPKGQDRMFGGKVSQVGLLAGSKKEAAASTLTPIGGRPGPGRVSSARDTHLDHAVVPKVDVAGEVARELVKLPRAGRGGRGRRRRGGAGERWLTSTRGV